MKHFINFLIYLKRKVFFLKILFHSNTNHDEIIFSNKITNVYIKFIVWTIELMNNKVYFKEYIFFILSLKIYFYHTIAINERSFFLLSFFTIFGNSFTLVYFYLTDFYILSNWDFYGLCISLTWLDMRNNLNFLYIEVFFEILIIAIIFIFF